MCGRFYIDADAEFLLNYFRIRYEPKIRVDHPVVFPSQTSPIVIGTATERRIGPMAWGFKLKDLNRPIINARSETVMDKWLFKQAFEKRRCLIPASGFYEWSQYEAVLPKPQFAISLTDSPLMGMAGIYQKQVDASGNEGWFFSVVTCDANEDMQKIHPRMPLLIHPDDFDLWLKPDSKLDQVRQLLISRDVHFDIERI